MKKLLLLLLLALPALGSAQSFNFNSVTNWTGAGSNEAAMVVDWHDGTTEESLVWGYKWSGSATGEQMIEAIAAANSATFSIHVTSYSFGDAIDGISFNGSSYGANGPGSHSDNGFGVGTTGYWDYYTGSGTSIPSSTWSESGVGAGSRTLTNLSWDGWSWAAGFNSIAPTDTPFAAPAPEPATYALGGMGLIAVLFRRRR